MKKILPVIILLLLCACSEPNKPSDAVGLDTTASSEISAESSLPQADNQPQASEYGSSSITASIDEEKQKLKELIAELTETSFMTVTHKNFGYLFLNTSEGNLICRMIILRNLYFNAPTLVLDQTIEIPIPDEGVFPRALANDGRTLEMSYDFWMYAVTLTIEKHNYNLDFKNATYTHEIKYRLKDLNLDRPMAASPDDKLKLYATYLEGGGEALGGDYVILDTETENIWYVASCDLYDQPFFCGADKILITRYNNMELLDVYTGNPLPTAPNFEYGQSEQFENTQKYRTLGVAYDNTQEKTLIAYRETYGQLDNPYRQDDIPNRMCKIYIAVFDKHGTQISTIDTGFMMQPWRSIFSNSVQIELAGNSEAVLSTYSDKELITLGKIEY